MADLSFQAFDADHHYYEHEDAFIRHIDPRMKRRAMDWAVVNGKKRLLVGGKINSFIPNPTFDPVAKPGILDEYFRGKNPDGKGIIELFGELDPINPAFRDRDARIKLLDTQGLEGCWMFPTLAVGMETALQDDPEAWFTWRSTGASGLEDGDIEAMIQQRTDARAAKDFATSDRIRDELADAGIVLEDKPDGTIWRRG